MPTTHLAGYDGSDASAAAVRFAARLAAPAHATVLAATVYESARAVAGKGAADGAVRALDDAARADAEELLDAADLGGVERLVLGARSPAAGLQQLAEERDAALVAIGVTHHGALGRAVPGTVGHRLLHGAPCPVAAVPAGADRPIETIAVAYDHRRDAAAALATAAGLARALGARLVVVVVCEPFLSFGAAGAVFVPGGGSRQSLRETIRAEVAELGVEADIRVLTGPVERTLLEVAEDGVDLLVAGSRAYGPVGSVLLGTVSGHLVDHAPCPVLVVPRGREAVVPPADEDAGGVARPAPAGDALPVGGGA